ncbi:MAG: hypothetical protein Q9163_000612 [Psora crenata]
MTTSRDELSHSEKVAMQSIVLQPFPDDDPLTQNLSREETLASACKNLELHQREVQEKIRLIAVTEKARLAVSPEEDQPRLLHPSDDPKPDEFRSAVRQVPAGKTALKQNATSPSSFSQYDARGHVGIAKRAISRLESHRKVVKPVLEQLRQELKGNAGTRTAPSETDTPDVGHAEDNDVEKARSVVTGQGR